jgi:predicted transcriptional regulator
MAIDAITNAKLFEPNNGIQATGSNYRSLYDFTNQYLPDAMPDLVNIFNPQSITGFLDSMGYEEELHSDLAIWGEYGRRHKLHTAVTRSANVFTSTAHSVRLGDKILVYATAAAGKEIGIVTARTANTFTAAVQNSAAWTVATTALSVRVIGDEHRKGTDGKELAITRDFDRYTVSPVIIKDQFSVDGSDIPNITWLYDNDMNPYWYMEDEVESFKRFLDNI